MRVAIAIICLGTLLLLAMYATARVALYFLDKLHKLDEVMGEDNEEIETDNNNSNNDYGTL